MTGGNAIPINLFTLPLPATAGRFRLGSCHAYGGVPEWLKGTDCKSVGYAYVGSNPTPSTNKGLQKIGKNECRKVRKPCQGGGILNGVL